jgi:hypothetical protein
MLGTIVNYGIKICLVLLAIYLVQNGSKMTNPLANVKIPQMPDLKNMKIPGMEKVSLYKTIIIYAIVTVVTVLLTEYIITKITWSNAPPPADPSSTAMPSAPLGTFGEMLQAGPP